MKPKLRELFARLAACMFQPRRRGLDGPQLNAIPSLAGTPRLRPCEEKVGPKLRTPKAYAGHVLRTWQRKASTPILETSSSCSNPKFARLFFSGSGQTAAFLAAASTHKSSQGIGNCCCAPKPCKVPSLRRLWRINQTAASGLGPCSGWVEAVLKRSYWLS